MTLETSHIRFDDYYTACLDISAVERIAMLLVPIATSIQPSRRVWQASFGDREGQRERWGLGKCQGNDCDRARRVRRMSVLPEAIERVLTRMTVGLMHHQRCFTERLTAANSPLPRR